MRATWKGPGSFSTSSGAITAGQQFDAANVPADYLAELVADGRVVLIGAPAPRDVPPVIAPTRIAPAPSVPDIDTAREAVPPPPPAAPIPEPSATASHNDEEKPAKKRRWGKR